MANPNQIQLDPIKYLNSIPQYNGNRSDLMTFIRLIDRIHPMLITYDELSQLVFSDIIKSRMVGKAREILEINTQARSWTSIKSVLENNFGEKKSCEELFDELRAVSFNRTTVDFYNDIKFRLRRLCNKAVMVLGEGEAANQVAINNQRSALHIFKNKMPEPMRTVLACRNPSTLEEAMGILFENGYDRMGKDGRVIKKQVNENEDNGSNQDSRNNSENDNRNYRNNQRNNYNRQNYNRESSNFNNSNNNRQNYRRENNSFGQNNREINGNNNQHFYNNNYNSKNNNRQNYRREDNSFNNNNQGNNGNNNRQFYNDQNYQQQLPQGRQPEPMEVNNVQNFQEAASTANFHI